MKSLFRYTKQQRIGIFLLIFVIVVLQIVLFIISNETISKPDIVNENVYTRFKNEVDSLKRIKEEEKKPKIYPFSPNFITDYKGYVLGMSTVEIDRLLEYRKQGKWVNSVKQFQGVTKISDSLLSSISPYFKFPQKFKKQLASPIRNTSSSKKNIKIDLNKASSEQLEGVYGVGEVLSKRIIEYRNKYNGFASEVELKEIYGLKAEVIAAVKLKFEIKTPRIITKIPLNTAVSDDLVTIKYIDYEIAYKIIEYRTLRKRFTALEELKAVKDFPVKKYDIIKLYLQLN